MSESSCKVKIVIDMSFENLMNQRDLGKCLKQLMHCYSINRRLQNPLQLHITSFESQRLKEEMNRHQGYQNWDCYFHTKSYIDIFKSDAKDTETPLNGTKLIYLTSESDNILGDTLDPECAYVIGGLVDHNAQKGLCHRLAVEKGVSHARLPIHEVGVEMKTRQVLTIDHVFRIVAAVASEGKTWKEALLDTLPERKGAKDLSTPVEEKNSKNQGQIGESGHV